MKTPVLESHYNKVADLQPCNIIKKRLQHKYFPKKFAKFLLAPSFTVHLRWLLLPVKKHSLQKTKVLLFQPNEVLPQNKILNSFYFVYKQKRQ